MQTPAEMMARLHLAKAEEFWLADRLEQAHAAMVLALRAGVSPSDVYDRQRAIEAELAARRAGHRWRVTEHLELELPEALPAITRRRIIARAWDGWLEVTETLHVRWGKHVLITFFPTHEASAFLHARYGYYANRTEWHKVCLPFAFCSGRADLRRAVIHEVTHAALHDATPDDIPRWLDEGFAVWMEGGIAWREMAELRTLAARGRLPSMDEVAALLSSYSTSLDSARAVVAYAAAADFVTYLGRSAGTAWPVSLLRSLRQGQRLADAFRAVVGTTIRAAESAWAKSLTVEHGTEV